MTAEEIHLKAAKYAQDYCDRSIEYRKQINSKPFDLYASGEVWLHRYEGYKAALTELAL